MAHQRGAEMGGLISGIATIDCQRQMQNLDNVIFPVLQ